MSRVSTPQLRLNDSEADILVEIANIGANHAAGALSKMIKERVDVKVPVLELAEIERAQEAVGQAEEGMTGITVSVTGDVRGVIFLLFTPEAGQQLVAEIAKGQETSALEEIANIICGAALGSLQKFLGLKLHQTVPGSASDMLGAMVDDTVAEAGSRADHILLMGMQFSTARRHVAGKLFFMFEPESTTTILRASMARAEAMKI